MKTKSEKVLLIGIGIILISFLLNSLYAHNKRLDEVVFFDHYYDINSSSGASDITLYYLTNADDKRQINTIQAYDLRMSTTFSNEYYFNFHKIVELHMHISPEELEGKTYTKGTIYFNDNTEEEVSLGVFNVYEGERSELARMHMSSSSNTGECQVVYDFEEPLTLKNIHTNLQDQIENNLNIVVETDLNVFDFDKRIEEDTEYMKLSDISYPIIVNKNIRFSTLFTNKNFSVYNIVLTVEFEEVDEKIYVYNIHSTPELTQKTIDEFLESRGL